MSDPAADERATVERCDKVIDDVTAGRIRGPLLDRLHGSVHRAQSDAAVERASREQWR